MTDIFEGLYEEQDWLDVNEFVAHLEELEDDERV